MRLAQRPRVDATKVPSPWWNGAAKSSWDPSPAWRGDRNSGRRERVIYICVHIYIHIYIMYNDNNNNNNNNVNPGLINHGLLIRGVLLQ
jgi:hypothetical protein